MNYIIDLENKLELPDKLKSVQREFFENYSKNNSEKKIQDSLKFPYAVEKNITIEKSPSLGYNELKEY